MLDSKTSAGIEVDNPIFLLYGKLFSHISENSAIGEES
jgi:hypothetical protein